MNSENTAMAMLADVYHARSGAGLTDGAAVGVFGNGLPTAMLEALGLVAVDVKLPPAEAENCSAGEIAAFIEPFVDDYARVFLNRLVSGAFDDLGAIVFCRDDAAALIAYQYAQEIIRQKIARRPLPKMLLWNLVHRETEPVRRFNLGQMEMLRRQLLELGVTAMPEAGTVIEAALDRARALRRLEGLRDRDGPVLSGNEMMQLRNAGRFLPMALHARLMNDVAEIVERRGEVRTGLRIGLVGSSLDDEAVYRLIEEFGTVVADLQPFGDPWPVVVDGGPQDLQALVHAEAADRFCPRFEPATAHRAAIVERCVAARCDIVVSQLDQNDDSVGWDLPSLKSALEAHGILFVNLGFRDLRVGEDWITRSRAILAEARGRTQ